MKQIKTIKVPSTLFMFQSNETLNEMTQHFTLCIYTYLTERKGMDDKVYCCLSDILENCGYKNNSNAYRSGYFDSIKNAIWFLQENHYIITIKNSLGSENLNIKFIKPKETICIELPPENIYFSCRFATIPYDAYCKLQKIKIENNSLYWKCLMVFCYICYELMYDPYTGTAKNASWTFSQERIAKNLRSKFSIPTMQKILNALQEYDIVVYTKAYVKIKKDNSEPYCIGTVICLVNGKDKQTLRNELKTIKIDAQNIYIANYKKA